LLDAVIQDVNLVAFHAMLPGIRRQAISAPSFARENV
jgi:hypothetical protein